MILSRGIKVSNTTLEIVNTKNEIEKLKIKLETLENKKNKEFIELIRFYFQADQILYQGDYEPICCIEEYPDAFNDNSIDDLYISCKNVAGLIEHLREKMDEMKAEAEKHGVLL